jgi:hypothetical protein
MFKVSWNQNARSLASLDEVEHLLDRLQEEFRQGDPTLVVVALSGDGDSLTIGLGRRSSVLSYIPGDMDPPYFNSAGGKDLDVGMWFLFEGSWSEFANRNIISTSVARATLRRFCETGQLPDSIEWEEV